MARRKSPSRPAPSREIAELRARLAGAEEALRAIRAGEVDSVVVPGKKGPQVFTLEGAGDAYRVLIESMNEGALTLTADKMILYANRCFARMVKCPLEQVTGGSLRRFLSLEDRAALRPLLLRRVRSGAKIQVLLRARDGSTMPAQISVPALSGKGSAPATIGIVVTDMTEARRNEETLRALTRRVVEVQESERARVALELHQHITQMLCAVLFRSQALAAALSGSDGHAKKEALKLREMLGETAEEVERISRNLRPSILDQLGLAAVLHSTSTEFTQQTGVPVELACVKLVERLPAASELALYRVLQEALKNVEQHARARHVTVGLTQPGGFVHLSVTDDGIGFDTARSSAERRARRGLGLLSMGERAAYVGGALTVRTAPGKGTTIRVRIPFERGTEGTHDAA